MTFPAYRKRKKLRTPEVHLTSLEVVPQARVASQAQVLLFTSLQLTLLRQLGRTVLHMQRVLTSSRWSRYVAPPMRRGGRVLRRLLTFSGKMRYRVPSRTGPRILILENRVAVRCPPRLPWLWCYRLAPLVGRTSSSQVTLVAKR